MSRSRLDDPAVRDAIVAEIEAGGNLDTAGASLSPPITRQAINNWIRNRSGEGEPGALLRDRIEAAKVRYRATRGELARAASEIRPATPGEQLAVAESLGVAVEVVQDGDGLYDPPASLVARRAWQAANDPDEHPAVRAVCWRGVFEYKLGPLIAAEERKVQRELERAEQADGAGDVLVVELPDNGTHAPRAAESRPIDVEVIDG